MLASSFAIALVVALTVASPGPAPARRAAARDVVPRDVIMTVGDDMKFSIETIEAKPGERLRVVLKLVGALPRIAMAHNFVLLRAGVDPVAFTKESVHAVPPDFMPPNAKRYVLAATALGANGDTVEVTFDAPAKPGRYTYICAYPGHFMSGARGNLIVKNAGQEDRHGSF